MIVFRSTLLLTPPVPSNSATPVVAPTCSSETLNKTTNKGVATRFRPNRKDLLRTGSDTLKKRGRTGRCREKRQRECD
eukprot:4589242-Pleurochrysis_carterae.AAC.1